MTGSLNHSTSADHELLVAYLDGELSPEEAQRVERRLGHDESFRRLLRSLQEAWDLLDELPQPTLDDAFTRTTVEMVAVRTSQEIQKQEARWHRRRWIQRGLQCATIGLSLLLGYWGLRHIQSRDDRELLEDLPVIQNVDLYRDIDNLEFLERLAAEGLFTGSLDEESDREDG
jgi:anti-sigma-K factor RskA